MPCNFFMPRADGLKVIIARNWRSSAISNRADWDLDNFRGGSAPVLFFALSVRAAPCLDDRLVEKIRQIVSVDIGAENHVPAAAAVATVRAATRHEFFAAETDAAGAAVAA